MKSSSAPAVVVCALAGALFVRAQDPQPADAPLTLGQQYLYTTNKIFGPGALSLVALKASFDEALDRPNQWGTGADSYAVRAASRFGRSFLRQNIAFGVRALDGEDPRYFVSGHGSKWERTKYAIGHTFAVRDNRGTVMPAYALLVSDFAMPFLANEWRPDRLTVGREFRSGAGAIGISVGSNIFQEFWPDLRKKLPQRFRQH